MSQHTPGPWTVAPGQFIVADWYGDDPTTGKIVAEVPCQGANPADLALIAAAPELLAMLRDLSKAILPTREGHRDGGTFGALSRVDDAARALLARIEGPS